MNLLRRSNKCSELIARIYSGLLKFTLTDKGRWVILVDIPPQGGGVEGMEKIS
jgi:hypothetical protein